MRSRALLLTLLMLGVGFAGCLGDGAPAATTASAPDVAPSEAALRLGATLREPVLDDAIATLRDALLETGRIRVAAEPAYLLAGLDPRDGGPIDVELDLTPSTLVREDTWAEIDGERVPLPFVEVYEGHLAGDPSSPARLTIAEGWARGAVRIEDVTYRIRVNLDGNFPSDADWDAAEPESEEMRAALLSPTWTFDKDGVEPHDCLSLVPQPIVPVTDREGVAGAPLELAIVLDSDAAFGRIFGVHTFPLLVAFLAEVDHIYAHEVGIRYHVVGVHAHTDPDALSHPDDAAPLGDLATYWNARTDERDLVHLVTGFPSSYAQANCIGGAGIPELAYTFTTVHWGKESYGKHRHIQTYAHEIGHILNAHHHYGNAVEGGVSTTIMHQGGEKVHPVFSTLTRSVIRGWAEAHLGHGDHDERPPLAPLPLDLTR